MPKYRFVDKSGTSQPVLAIFFDDRFNKLYERCSKDGCVEIPDIPRAKHARIFPRGNFWSKEIIDIKCKTPYVLEEIQEQERGWWDHFLVSSQQKRQSSIRIGVIDLGMAESAKSRILYSESLKVLHERRGEHGSHTCSILSKALGRTEHGVCDSINIVAFDAGQEEVPLGDCASSLSSTQFDTAQVIEGINHLSKREDVDLINISGGIPSDNLNHLLIDAIDEAEQWGTLVIAAVGNDSCKPIAQPASYSNVVGVGGIGVGEFGPKDNLLNAMRRRAHESNLILKMDCGLTVFPDLDVPTGYGLDVAAPSIGVTLTVDHNISYDLNGTSFASPMVTALLAIALDGNNDYRAATGTDKPRIARACLANVSKYTLKGSQHEGVGIPMLI